MESLYLTPFKLEAKKLAPLSGSTPQFPDKFKHLISINTGLKESRQDSFLSSLYELFRIEHQINKENLHFTLGGSMAFFETLLFLLKKIEVIAFEIPYYEPYVAVAQGLGFQTCFFKKGSELELGLNSNKTAVCLTSPNFFNGTFFSNDDLISLSNKYRYIILDEVFHASFSSEQAFISKLKMTNLIKINSLSKSIGLSMIRFGWISASEEIIAEIQKISLLTFTDYPTPSLRIAFSILSNISLIIKEIGALNQPNRITIKLFKEQFPDIKFSHSFQNGHFGSIQMKQDLSAYCLNSSLFGETDLWRFRIDVSSDLLDSFLRFIDKKV